MDLEAIKEATLAFFKGYYAEHGGPPSVKLACKEVEGLYRNLFYLVFKDGVAEACTLSGIPVPADRIKTTSKAREEKKSQKTPEKLEEEIAADEEEEALAVAQRKQAAEERARKARNELIEIEAKHDPKKIIPYLRTLEPEIVAPFFDLCKEMKITPRRAWAEAVKVQGENFEEWERILKADEEEPHFKAYVSDVIDVYIPKKRLEIALQHHQGRIYSCTCDKCGLQFEYENKDSRTVFSCSDGCIQGHGGVESVYFCPVCGELGNGRKLVYNRDRGVIYCKVCGFEVEVRGKSLNPMGTKAGAFKPQIAELEKELKNLRGKLNETQGQINAGDGNIQALERKRQQEESSVTKLKEERKNEDKKLDEARDETAKERRLVTSLKKENSVSRRKRKIYNGMAEFLTNPEMIDKSAIDDIIRTLEVARDLRKNPGHVGETMEMTADIRDGLLKRIAKGRFILKDKAEKRLKQELAKQQCKHDVKLKAKDTTIAAERREREEVELRLEEAMKIVNSPMVEGLRGLLGQNPNEESIIASG